TLRPPYISPKSQVFICLCLIIIQLLLSLLWLAYERPIVNLIPYERLVIVKCDTNKHSFLLSLIYNALLITICTVYAVRTRKVPENFNETKFIGFTCYTTCIIWLAFLPIYYTAYDNGRHQVHITTLCITISLSATVALVCLFSPKVYIILVHPEKNMRLTKQLRPTLNSLKFAAQIPHRDEHITATGSKTNNANDNTNHVSQAAIATSPLIKQTDIVLKNNSSKNVARLNKQGSKQ
ncbi:unnamed protein product, partial [Didymodactylos carnosus]